MGLESVTEPPLEGFLPFRVVFVFLFATSMLPGYIFLMIAENGFLAFTDEGAKYFAQRPVQDPGPSCCSAGGSCFLAAGFHWSLVVTPALVPFPGVRNPTQKGQIRRPVSIIPPLTAIIENSSSNWFKPYRKFISFHQTGSWR